MQFKLDIGDPKSKKTFHLETSSEAFIGKKIGETVKGDSIKEASLSGYEFSITGATDNAGFPALAFVEGGGRKRVLLTRGKGLKRVKKKKKKKKPVRGLRMRKMIHGNTIGEDIAQINLKVVKEGGKPLTQVFGKEEKSEEKVEEKKEEVKKEEPKPEPAPATEEPKQEEKEEEKQVEAKVEEKKEEKQVEAKVEEKKEEKKEEKAEEGKD